MKNKNLAIVGVILLLAVFTIACNNTEKPPTESVKAIQTPTENVKTEPESIEAESTEPEAQVSESELILTKEQGNLHHELRLAGMGDIAKKMIQFSELEMTSLDETTKKQILDKVEELKVTYENVEGLTYTPEISKDLLMEVIEIDFTPNNIKQLQDFGFIPELNENAQYMSISKSKTLLETSGWTVKKYILNGEEIAVSPSETTEAQSLTGPTKIVFSRKAGAVQLTLTLEGEGDKVKRWLQFSDFNTESLSEEQMAQVKAKIEELKKVYNEIEGVQYTPELTATSLEETIDISLNAQNLNLLISNGLLPATADSNVDHLSMKQIKQFLENNDWTVEQEEGLQ